MDDSAPVKSHIRSQKKKVYGRVVNSEWQVTLNTIIGVPWNSLYPVTTLRKGTGKVAVEGISRLGYAHHIISHLYKHL